LRRIALVIDVERSAPPVDGAVIHHRDPGCGHALADAPGKRRAALAVEIAFEAMADRLVQQHTGPARPEHHGHGAGRCRPRRQVGCRLVHRLGGVFPEDVVAEVSVVETPAAAGAALFTPAVFLDDHLQRQARQRPHVGGKNTVGARHQDDLVFSGQRGHHLHHPAIERARVALQLFQQLHFFLVGEASERIVRQIQLAALGSFHRPGRARAPLARDGARRVGGRFECRYADVIRVGECGLFAAHRAYAHALVDVEAAGLDHAFLEAPALGARILEVQVGIVHAVAHDLAEHARQPAGVKSVRRKQRAVGGGK
jgi:hypothetical protein